jgi:hypothetical protein
MIIAIVFGVLLFLIFVLVVWWYRCCCCFTRSDKRGAWQRISDGVDGWANGGRRPQKVSDTTGMAIAAGTAGALDGVDTSYGGGAAAGVGGSSGGNDTSAAFGSGGGGGDHTSSGNTIDAIAGFSF